MVSTIVMDLAKTIFQVHGAGASGRVVFRKQLRRAKFLDFFRSTALCYCAGSLRRRRVIGGGSLASWATMSDFFHLNNVMPRVLRQKNDMSDAEAICEAAQRPTMRFVPVKSEEQQASGGIFRARDLLARQRT